jgi:hypothetical protein
MGVYCRTIRIRKLLRSKVLTRVTSPARKREMPLSEMNQLDKHLTLPHTLLEI